MTTPTPSQNLPTIFKPAYETLFPRYQALPLETKKMLQENLTTFEERQAAFKWNALLSQQDSRLLEPCQAIYQALMAWDSLEVVEKIAVQQAGLGPMAKLANDLGLIAR